MTLHLIKLSVGSTGPESLARWQKSLTAGNTSKTPYHVTRMFPRRKEELLTGGSIYWVIQGYISVRQQLLDVVEVTAADGTRKCRLDLDPVLIPVDPVAKRPFQGWRYLKAEDAPVDLKRAANDDDLLLRRRLAELGLL